MIRFVNATVCAALVASVAFGFAPTGVLAQEAQGNNLSSAAQPTSTKSVPAWQFLSRDAIPGQAKNADQVKSQALPLQLNAAEMFAMTPGAKVEISLPGAATYTVIFERAEQHGGGIASWIGYLQDFGKDYRVLITRGPNGTFGSVRIPGREFRIIPGSGHDWMVDMAQEQVLTPPIDLHDDVMVPPKREGVQPRSDPKFAPLPAGGSAPAQQDVPAPQVFIDLMIAYTAGLANHLGSNLMTRLNNLVAAANQSYIDSEVAITLRLVKTVMVNYSDVSDDGEALEDISPARPGFNAAVFGGIESQRAAAGADMVALLRDGENFSGHGIAWISDSSPSSSYLYSVTTGCVAGCESVLIHEMGHNMGNAHDRATVAYQAGGVASPPQEGAFSYSFGNFNCATGLTCNPNLPPGSGGCNSQPACASSNSNNFGTIMSYFNPTILKFSNPNITCTPPGGAAQPCGVSEASPNSSNNALSMNNMRMAISGIKPTVVGSLPGSLQFTANTFTGNESSGTLNFTVSRVGGSSGAVSVTYTTANGSAISGLDYGGGSGTLNWANGDTANKTISIPLVNDGVTEGSETFTVTLSNPSGATGVYLGSPSVATGLISEPWPAGGVMPSGFATPAGSSGAWTVVSDQVYEGTSSMRSAQVFGNMTSYVNSDLSFTGNFAASTLAFAYRVSSYQNYGVFDFIVDGATVLSDTGETGWKTFSSQLTAGSHTLIWRFRNRLSSACNSGWSPPPEGGAACADRAWIDAVSLPLVLTASSTNLVSSANPSRLNRSVSFTATVSGSAGTPFGNVIFKDNGATIAGCSSVALSSGSAVCATSALTLGSHSITAQYSGNSTYVTSTSGAVPQTVNPAGSGFSSPVMMLLLD